MIWNIKAIREGDFGCEELPKGTSPKATLYLESENGDEKSLDMTEDLIAERKLKEGQSVVLSPSYGVLRIVKVSGALITDDLSHPTKIFGTQRGYGEQKGLWEFPGGKQEIGETPEGALKREIREELAVEIEVGRKFSKIDFDYPTFHLTMDCYWCVVTDGHVKLLEHDDAAWLGVDDLDKVTWLPADYVVMDDLKQILSGEERESI